MLKMTDNLLDERHLHMRRIGNNNLLPALGIVKDNGVIGEDREAELPLITNQFDTILTGTLMTDEAPGSAAGKAIMKLETCTHGILGLI